jgi:hypothetical protein
MPILLRMHWLWRAAETQSGRLLRVLLLWRCAVSSDSEGTPIVKLHDLQTDLRAVDRRARTEPQPLLELKTTLRMDLIARKVFPSGARVARTCRNPLRWEMERIAATWRACVGSISIGRAALVSTSSLRRGLSTPQRNSSQTCAAVPMRARAALSFGGLCAGA